MKNAGIFILIISLLLINIVSAEIRINEIELNPSGDDNGKEWIELYSDNEINLTGWKLINHDNDIKNLNQNFKGYLVINLEGQWLDNDNESIILYNENTSIFFSPVLKDIFNDDKTWNYCNEKWVFLSSSKGYVNKCENNQTNIDNNTNIQINNPISINADWNDDEIINGKEFKMEIIAKNLEDKKYDIKVAIYDNEKKIISQIYNEDGKWVSSTEYFREFFNGPGDDTENLKVRIKESYEDFYGNAVVNIRIRETGGSGYKKEIEEDIEILKSNKPVVKDANENYSIVEIDDNRNLENIIENSGKSTIKLGNKEKLAQSIKTKNNIIYQSKNELIKDYAIYFFAFLCIAFFILVFIKKSDNVTRQ